jgi:hypothetical protein
MNGDNMTRYLIIAELTEDEYEVLRDIFGHTDFSPKFEPEGHKLFASIEKKLKPRKYDDTGSFPKPQS